jgi:hypothetical protein
MIRELLDPSELQEIQINLVVYYVMLVKWPVCQSIVVQSVVLISREAQQTESRYSETQATQPTLYGIPPNRSVFSCNSDGS